MQSISKSIKILVLKNGKSPFKAWFLSIKDRKAQIAIDARFARIRNGNLGVHKSLKDGIYELKIQYGGGVRVYFALEGQDVVIILCGGKKTGQKRDIAKANDYWRYYLNENR